MFSYYQSDSLYKYNCSIQMTEDTQDFYQSDFLILPYGKYDCCVNLIKNAYSYLNSDIKTIIFLIPTYNYCFENLITCNLENFLDIEQFVEVDYEKLNKLKGQYEISPQDMIFEFEEILTPHLEILKEKSPHIKIIPLFFYQLKSGIISKIIRENQNDFGFVFLSNLSCGFNYNDAIKIDSITANAIETNSAENIGFEQFSGYKILSEILTFTKQRKYNFIRLGLSNSASTKTNLASTVGYGAWMLFEDSSANFIKIYYSDLILDFVKFNLRKILHVTCSECFNLPEIFNQEFNISISFCKEGFVKGVSKITKQKEPLYKALVKNTFLAAMADDRFAPINADEIDFLKINITILTENVLESAVIKN